MNSNNVVAIVFICIALFACVAVYSDSKIKESAIQSGLQECLVTFDHGVKTVWQKECSK